MGFMESYKHLEKICVEIYEATGGVSAYIDEMSHTTHGSYYVPNWDDDLKRLKHYRWVRNRIAHEPNCTEQNMCESGDIEWLDHFYKRIINQNDPLTLYSMAVKPHSRAVAQRETSKPDENYVRYNYKQHTNQSMDAKEFFIMMLVFVFIIVAVILISKFFNHFF